MLEDDLGQFIGAISSDLVEPDTAQDQSQKSTVRVLTVGREASGSIPNAGEGGVRVEEVCHDLRAINTELVASDAANDNQTKASGGLDSRTKGMLQRTPASATPSCS